MKLCGFEAGLDRPFFLIAGPCVVESEQLQMDVAGQLKEMTGALGIPFIFKSSYDKANRSSGKSFRGPGMEKGLEILAKVRRTLGVPVLTPDVHTADEVTEVARHVDVLQTPAFLCRQTDFIVAVRSRRGLPVNIKKGQFLAPHDMKNVVDKAREASGQDNIMVCERGASFGYNNLVSDMRSLAIMRGDGLPGRDGRHHTPCSSRAGRAPPRAAARVRAGARAAAVATGRLRRLHGNPPRSREGAVGRPERMAAARALRELPRDAEGDRRAGEAARVRRSERLKRRHVTHSMKLLVLGAGGIGGYFGGRMAEAGVDTTFLVPMRSAASRSRKTGLVTRKPQRQRPHRGEDRPGRGLKPGYDLVLFTCKAYDLDSAMDAISPAMASRAAPCCPCSTASPTWTGSTHASAPRASWAAPARSTRGSRPRAR